MLSACCIFVILLKLTYTHTIHIYRRQKERRNEKGGRKEKKKKNRERDGRRGKQQTQFP